MVSWVLNKVSRILSSAGVIVCWLVLGYYSTLCGLRWPRNWKCLKNLMFYQLRCHCHMLLHAVIDTPPLFSIFVTNFASGPTSASTRTCLLWILLKLRMMEVVIAGANRCAKLQWNDHHQQTNTQLFRVQMPFMSPNQQCQSTATTYSYLQRW